MSISQSILQFQLEQPWRKSSLFDAVETTHDLSFDYDIQAAVEYSRLFDITNLDADLEPTPIIEHALATEQTTIDLTQLDVVAESDVWRQDFENTSAKPGLLGWQSIAAGSSSYKSDIGHSDFDVCVRRWQPNLGILPQDVVLRALCSLALGRSSTQYHWNEKLDSFERTLKDIPIAGCTGAVSDAILTRAIHQGNHIRRLRDAISRRSARLSTAVRTAHDRALSSILDEAEAWLAQSFGDMRTLAQFNAIIDRALPLLSLCACLEAKTRHMRGDQTILSILVQQNRKLYAIGDAQAHVVKLLTEDTALPYIERTLQVAGLAVDGATHKNDRARALANISEPVATMDMLLSQESEELIESITTERMLLEAHHPQHPLCHSHDVLSGHDLDSLLDRARQLQLKLEHTIAAYNSQPSTATYKNMQEPSLPQFEQPISDYGQFATSVDLSHDGTQAWATLDATPELPHTSLLSRDGISTKYRSQLQNAVNRLLNDQDAVKLTIGVDIDISFRLTILLEKQNRMFQQAVLSLLFQHFNLEEVFMLHRRCFMLQDADFTQHLRQALFDDRSVDKQHQLTRRHRTAGLCLNTQRDISWPPSSSHLSLTLSGILDMPALTTFRDISMSFAVRELTEDQIENVCKARSIHALDFLYLQCHVPSPLDQFFTPEISSWYEDIFACLLLHTRMLHLVTALRSTYLKRHLHWTTEPLKTLCLHQLYHVTTAMAAHAQQASTQPWQRFVAMLGRANSSTSTPFGDHDPAIGISRQALYAEHVRYLTQTRKYMFLGRRYQAVQSLQHQLYTVILDVDALSETSSTGALHTLHSMASSIIAQLRTTLAQLRDKLQGSSDEDDEIESRLIGQLMSNMQ